MSAAQQAAARGDRGELCSILVPSCDAYADLWAPFITLFFQHWPDCPFPLHLGSNAADYDHPRVRMVHAGHGANWANRVREQLEALSTPYVLLMLEDFFLRRPVDNAAVLEAFDTLRALDGEVVRLVHRPGPDRGVAGSTLLGELSPGAPYRVSTQAAIWRRSTLLGLMRPDESIWQFELLGSRRSDVMPGGFYGVRRSVLTYDHHVVERGKWFPWEARRFGRMNIGCDFERRPVMSRGEAVRWSVAKSRGVALGLLPWRVRVPLVRVTRRALARARGAEARTSRA